MPAFDWSRMLSGHPEGAPDPEGELGPGDALLISSTFTSFKLPFGTTYAVNLTPDIDTGTGRGRKRCSSTSSARVGTSEVTAGPCIRPMPWDWYRADAGSGPQGDLRVPEIHSAAPQHAGDGEDPAAGRRTSSSRSTRRSSRCRRTPRRRSKGRRQGPGRRPSTLKPGAGRQVIRAGSYPADLVAKGKSDRDVGAPATSVTRPGSSTKRFGVPAPDFTRMLSGHPEGAPDPQGKLGPRGRGDLRADVHEHGAAVRRRVREEPDAGPRDRDREVDGRSSSWPMFRKARHPGRAHDPPADAVGHDQALVRRGSARGLRVPSDPSADPQRGARLEGAPAAWCR